MQQFLYSAPTDRIDQIRRDLRQWNQHKSTLSHAGMRHSQTILSNAQIIVKNDVDIDGTWPVAKRWLPPDGYLNLFGSSEKFLWREPGLARTDDIEKAWLVSISNWLCLINRRNSRNLHHVA